MSCENYCLLGPWFEEEATAVFDPITDESDPILEVVNIMRENGLDVHYGKWIISGRPRVVLFNPKSAMQRLADIKYKIWEHHGISIPANDQLLDQVVSFGFMMEEFFKLIAHRENFDYNIIAHFHEWMAGVPIPELRRENLNIKIVFTTHATMLGRYLAMNDVEFYDHLPFYNWETEAIKFNILPLVLTGTCCSPWVSYFYNS